MKLAYGLWEVVGLSGLTDTENGIICFGLNLTALLNTLCNIFYIYKFNIIKFLFCFPCINHISTFQPVF